MYHLLPELDFIADLTPKGNYFPFLQLKIYFLQEQNILMNI